MKTNFSLITIACAVLLSACGGGGDSAAVAPAATTPPPPVVVTPPAPTVTPADIQTSVAASTYAQGSQEMAFFTTFNDFRSKLGLGLLAQNSKLDVANQNHLKYLMTNTAVDFSAIDPKNGRPYFHSEDPARPNYTGISELDRAKFAQYSGVYVGETGAYGKGQGATVAISDLIATVYHRAGLMFQFPREVGVAVGTDPYQTMVMTFGYQTTQQRNASDYVGTYPADNQTDVPLVAYIETPNPFPEVAYADFNTKTSFPISFVTEASTTISVTSFTVTEAGQSMPHDARLLTKETDPNKQLAANIAFLVGKTPFKGATTYNVKFVGTRNGVAVTKTWSFKTKA